MGIALILLPVLASWKDQSERIANLEGEVRVLNAKLDSFLSIIGTLSTRVDEHGGRLRELEKEMADIRARVQSLERQ